MIIPLIDLFRTPYTNSYMNCCLISPYQAAVHAAKTVGTDQGLTFHIEDAIKQHPSWLSYMPETTPKPIAEYQGDTYCCDLKAVSEAIRLIGRPVMPGQYLFHGGKWPTEYKHGAIFETTRPLSTTLCPNIAMGVPQWHGRAYRNNAIDLFVLRVSEPRAKGFFFNSKDIDTGHEKELVFEQGVKLTLTSCEDIQEIPVADFNLSSSVQKTKDVTVRVLAIEIS